MFSFDFALFAIFKYLFFKSLYENRRVRLEMDHEREMNAQIHLGVGE